VENKAVISYQGFLGLVIVVTGAAMLWFHMGGLTTEGRPVRAKSEALELAWATMDYRADRGQWPRDTDGEIDLTLLLGPASRRNNTSMAGASQGAFPLADSQSAAAENAISWIREVPLDPWGNPYHVVVENGTIAVLSTGPDGRCDTDPHRLWTRTDQVNPCAGDDVGLVLELDSDGGLR
jgi:hypothetical protein